MFCPSGKRPPTRREDNTRKGYDLFPAHLSGQRLKSRDWTIELPEFHIVAVDEFRGARDRGFIVDAVHLNHPDRYAVSSHDKSAICRHSGLQQELQLHVGT